MMKRGWKFAVGGLALAGVLFLGALTRAKGWENLKLQSGASAVLLSDRAQQAIAFNKQRENSANARITLNDLLSGGVAQASP